MSVNCVNCVKRERTGIDMLCDVCRSGDPVLMRVDELQALELVLKHASEKRPVSDSIYEMCRGAVDELIAKLQNT